ncbi:hypothetical protein HN954_01980 [bacterium]|jgi:hypothetical protein|nr:hypothetical protein [bacterium]MBT6831528.1 hypothetical protein [bacterium]MBT6996179.1 hypothetical protein [bacterium]MBT7772561.1 hypothetical protein [bacterium]
MKKILLGLGILLCCGTASAQTPNIQEAINLKIQHFEILRDRMASSSALEKEEKREIAGKITHDIQILEQQKVTPDLGFLRDFEQKTKLENQELLKKFAEAKRERLEQKISNFEKSDQLENVDKTFLRDARKKLQSRVNE